LSTRQTLNATLKDMNDFAQKEQDATEANALGWFLLSWKQGNLTAAREIRDRTRADAPAHAVMSFLTDDSRTPQQLIAAIPPGLQYVGQLAIGERYFKRNEVDAARTAFTAAVQAIDNDPNQNWDVNRKTDVRTIARARLDEIDRAAANQARSTGPTTLPVQDSHEVPP
jgi:hypothetical protein